MRNIRTLWASVVIALAAVAVGAMDKSADDSRLTVSLAQARMQRLNDLHEYAENGVFPHNHGHPGQRIPHFMDRHGRLCAVGYLIAKSMAGKTWDYQRFMDVKGVAVKHSGVGGIATPGYIEWMQMDRESNGHLLKLLGFFNNIATTNNNIRIKDVHDGPVLDWILHSGLTQEEAALIQPGYSYLACDECLPGSEEHPMTFGQQTAESKRVEEEDRIRIRTHLLRTEGMLRRDSTVSLKTCVARLKARVLESSTLKMPTR